MADSSPRTGTLGGRRLSLAVLMFGDWGRVLRDPIDLLRMSLLVGAFVMSAQGELEDAVRLLLTFSVLVAARALEPPRLFDLTFTLGMLLQGWGNALELFDTWSGYNKVVHFVLPFGGASMLYILLARLDMVPDLDHPCERRHLLGIVIVTLALGSTAGALYEVWEWFIHHNLSAPIDVGYDDTVTDLLDNALGSLAGGLLLAWWGSYGWGTKRRPLRSPVASAEVDRV